MTEDLLIEYLRRDEPLNDLQVQGMDRLLGETSIERLPTLLRRMVDEGHPWTLEDANRRIIGKAGFERAMRSMHEYNKTQPQQREKLDTLEKIQTWKRSVLDKRLRDLAKHLDGPMSDLKRVWLRKRLEDTVEEVQLGIHDEALVWP